MKVNRPEIISLVNKIMKQDQVRGKNNTQASPSVPRVDRVEISAGSEILKKEMSRLDEIDASQAEKLSELASRIEAGEYKVDAQELADTILQAIEQGRIS